MNQEKIGKFIAECRKKQKKTQTELAEKLGVSDRTVGNWENGRNMPDLSLFKPLCNELAISLNDLMSGEKVTEKEYQEKLEENIINTIHYTNKKIERKNNILNVLIIIFGTFISVTALAIFPSESSWGAIYSIFGIIVSSVGISKFTKRIPYGKRILCNISYFVLFLFAFFLIDYIGVVNMKQAPRYSIMKITGEDMVYYDTLFFDVVRCNKNKENETFKIIKNQKYDRENIDTFCK